MKFIKDFLKPTVVKIIFVIIIALLSLTIGISKGHFNTPSSVNEYIHFIPPICFETIIFNEVFWPIFLISGGPVCADLGNTNPIVFIFLVGISSLLYWYLTVCLCVAVGKKWREKLTNNTKTV